MAGGFRWLRWPTFPTAPCIASQPALSRDISLTIRGSCEPFPASAPTWAAPSILPEVNNTLSVHVTELSLTCTGAFLYGEHGEAYTPALAPLPPINVRVNGNAVEVWTV